MDVGGREHWHQSETFLDEQIAQKVFGWKTTKFLYIHSLAYSSAFDQSEDFGGKILMPPSFVEEKAKDFRFKVLKVPKYSTSLEEAMKVLEHIQFKLDPLGRMWRPELTGYSDKWRCAFELCNGNAGDDVTYHFAEAKTLQEAICLAALNAVEES